MTQLPDRGAFRAVVGDPDRLLDGADRAADPTEFVVTPERLHRRNLKRRLAERGQPRSSLWLTDATAIASELLATADRPHDTVDRIDRLKHLEAQLGRDTEPNERLRAAFGSDLTARVETVAAAHSRVAEMTGWEPDSLDALSKVADRLPAVASRDAADIIAGVRALERGLTDRVGAIHSRERLLPAAAEALRERPELWNEAFPTADRLSVAGVSAVDAPLRAVLDAAASAGVDVRLVLRPGTGPAIVDRLRERVELAPSESVGGVAPVLAAAEFVVDTPEAEARLAAAVVAAHIRNGAAASDVVVVARDAAEYERPLRQAAERHGLQLSVWAQLPVERTIPYRQFAAVCALLGGDEPELGELLAPLEFRWVPPELATETAPEPTVWPLSPAHIGAVRAALAADSGSPTSADTLEGWVDRVDAAVDADELRSERAQPLRTLLSWACDQPGIPDPVALHRTFRPVIEANREVALPAVFADDSVDLGRSSRYARALSRVEELLTDTRAKYDEWLAAGDVPRSWLAVADLAERVVTTRPGRREHANAATVDVIDGTDAWLRDVPHVVAVGLVDGVWPRRTESVFPEAFRSAVVAGDSAAARQLAAPGRWTAAREADHLASGLGAASETLACTRYRRDREGTTRERSPLLASVQTTTVDDEATQSLLATGTLPDALVADGGDAP